MAEPTTKGRSKRHMAASSSSMAEQMRAKKRRLNERPALSTQPGSNKLTVDLTQESDGKPDRPHKASRPPASTKDETVEKRLRKFRTGPPRSFQERYERAQSQRMFVIKRERKGTEEEPQEIVDLAGSTGNIYQVAIDKMPTCTCPDNVKGNQCKHIIYIVCNVLKAPAHLRYQLAYLSSELREIFQKAPASRPSQASSGKASNRKPVEGDCPICFMAFDPKEDTLYCKSSCGNNVHKECFQQWATAQAGKEIRCVYCRAAWKCDDETRDMIQRLLEQRKQIAVSDEGYLNVAHELGISSDRDHSTYHQPWVFSRGRTIRYADIL